MRWLRTTALIIATAVVGLVGPTAAGHAATSENPRYACATRPITWSIQVVGSSALRPATEQSLVTKALAQITAATGGSYTFTFVPTADPTGVWGVRPLPLEVNLPDYTTNPVVDMLFLVVPKRAIGPDLPVGNPFAHGPASNVRTTGTYFAPASNQVFRAIHDATLLTDVAVFSKYSATVRSSYYLAGADYALGLDSGIARPTLSAKEKAALRDLAAKSCALVGQYPDAKYDPQHIITG